MSVPIETRAGKNGRRRAGGTQPRSWVTRWMMKSESRELPLVPDAAIQILVRWLEQSKIVAQRDDKKFAKKWIYRVHRA